MVLRTLAAVWRVVCSLGNSAVWRFPRDCGQTSHHQELSPMLRSKPVSIVAAMTLAAFGAVALLGAAPAAAFDPEDLSDLPIRQVLPAPSLPVPVIIVTLDDDDC